MGEGGVWEGSGEPEETLTDMRKTCETLQTGAQDGTSDLAAMWYENDFQLIKKHPGHNSFFKINSSSAR